MDHAEPRPGGVTRAAEPRLTAVHEDRAGVAAVGVHSREDLDQGRLPRPVLAAEAVDLAGPHLEVDPIEGPHAAEVLDDLSGLEPGKVEHRAGHFKSSARWKPSRTTVASRLSRSTTMTGSRMLGTSMTPLGTPSRAMTGLPPGECDRHLRGPRGQPGERLVHRHRLRPADDPLAGGQVGILARHQHLAGESLLRERLDRAPRRAVVGGEHGVERRPDRRDRRAHDPLGLGGLPPDGIVLVHHRDVTSGDQRSKDLVLALLEEEACLVGLGPVNADDTSLAAELPDQVFRLQAADADVVEAEVKVDLAAGDQPVVADHRDAGRASHRDGAAHRGRVVRHDNQHVHPSAQERLDVLNLPGRVAVPRLDQDLGPELLGPRDEPAAVALPAFLLERAERQPDPRPPAVPHIAIVLATPPRKRDPDQNAEEQREQHESGSERHVGSMISGLPSQAMGSSVRPDILTELSDHRKGLKQPRELTPVRTLTITVDPHHHRTVRV